MGLEVYVEGTTRLLRICEFSDSEKVKVVCRSSKKLRLMHANQVNILHWFLISTKYFWLESHFLFFLNFLCIKPSLDYYAFSVPNCHISISWYLLYYDLKLMSLNHIQDEAKAIFLGAWTLICFIRCLKLLCLCFVGTTLYFQIIFFLNPLFYFISLSSCTFYCLY